MRPNTHTDANSRLSDVYPMHTCTICVHTYRRCAKGSLTRRQTRGKLACMRIHAYASIYMRMHAYVCVCNVCTHVYVCVARDVRCFPLLVVRKPCLEISRPAGRPTSTPTHETGRPAGRSTSTPTHETGRPAGRPY